MMFFYSIKSRSKVLHLENCHHLKRIKKANVKTITSSVDGINKGFKICKCCSPLTKDYRKNKDEILNYAYNNGICCNLHNGYMYVQTCYDEWMILASGRNNRMDLHHKNKFVAENTETVRGYHNQHFGGCSVMEFLQYISNHEWFRTLYPLQIRKEKQPPQKGTKRWHSQQKMNRKKERINRINNVLSLIDSLST